MVGSNSNSRENDNIKIISEEEMLGDSERWFTSIIRYIENVTRNEEERLALFSTYNRGIKASINLFYETKNRIEYVKDPLSIYALGVKESIYTIEDMINDMIGLMEKRGVDTTKDRIGISFIQVYIKGIKLATDLYQRNKLNDDTIKLIEDLDIILSDYKGKDPEEIWENIRNRIGVSIEF